MENPIKMTLNIYNACRTNTGRAAKNDGHYDLARLAQISGARFDDLIGELQWCAEHKEDQMAIYEIQRFAEALLSAYEIQSRSFK